MNSRTIFEQTWPLVRTAGGSAAISGTVDPFTGRTALTMPVVARHPANPILSREHFWASVQQQALADVACQTIPPSPCALQDTFNCGVSHFGDQYVMLVRFQNMERYNHVYLATSTDGVNWTHQPRLLKMPDLPASPHTPGIAASGHDVSSETRWHPGIMYDPRITQIEDTWYVTFAVDYDTIEPPGRPYINICDSVLYRTTDFRKFEFVTTLSGHTRNCVLFPRRIDGYYYAAGRPNAHKRAHTVLMRSTDLKQWQEVCELFTGGHAWMIYAGPGFPPFETEDYWVFGVHGVETHGTFQVVYRAGVCLLDRKTMKVVAGPVPIMHPDQPYEMSGTVSHVIFPTGVLFGDGNATGVKSADTKIALYYGAADSNIGVGVTTVGKLIQAARESYNPLIVLEPRS